MTTTTQDSSTDPQSLFRKREVHVADAMMWLEQNPLSARTSIIASLPDWSEFSNRMSLLEWKNWFQDAVNRVLISTPDQGVAVFFQTDIKVEGEWIDKAYLCQRAAEESGHALLWHKVVCKAPPGNATFGRPGYSHLLAFSRTIRADVSQSTADVLPQTGEVTWARGMGVDACRAACRMIQTHTDSDTILDPFCGHGTVLAVAESLGFRSIGVELGASRARKARQLILSPSGELEFVPRESDTPDGE